eukprot:NODE_467_length_3021_cov_4.129233.p4 GENE.NODE_467_length_3021_cov_4.129233~~NODE_467_length_3021_cov_4.129233.p4  ORF type:complete len:139 (-),score=32.12 NODE_467_length_3021_cov_4.129233:2206-2622(-)
MPSMPHMFEAADVARLPRVAGKPPASGTPVFGPRASAADLDAESHTAQQQATTVWSPALTSVEERSLPRAAQAPVVPDAEEPHVRLPSGASRAPVAAPLSRFLITAATAAQPPRAAAGLNNQGTGNVARAPARVPPPS